MNLDDELKQSNTFGSWYEVTYVTDIRFINDAIMYRNFNYIKRAKLKFVDWTARAVFYTEGNQLVYLHTKQIISMLPVEVGRI